jgi:RimJ/RimL family protein N-acetyltransferase
VADSPEEIRTARLRLRRPGPDELPAYVAVLGEEDAERDHREALAHWRAHGFGPWLVELHGEPVGVVEIHYAGPGVTGIEPHEVEIGWAIVERERGRGFATEAARAALVDAFDRARPNFHGWIVAYIRPENEVSTRVATRIGMRHVAHGLTRSGDLAEIWRASVESGGSDSGR